MVEMLINYRYNNILNSVSKFLTKIDMGWTWRRLVNSATWVAEAGE